MVYYFETKPADDDYTPPSKMKRKTILCLSTELEVAGLVWVVKKIRHLIENAEKPTTIYTDHAATVQIIQQSSLNTTSTEKLKLRLIRASEFLQRFNLIVKHVPGKTHTVPENEIQQQQKKLHP